MRFKWWLRTLKSVILICEQAQTKFGALSQVTGNTIFYRISHPATESRSRRQAQDSSEAETKDLLLSKFRDIPHWHEDIGELFTFAFLWKGFCKFNWTSSVNSEIKLKFLTRMFPCCQAQVRSPKVQSPKVKTKGTWADTKIPWATTTPPPITFKHEGVLW